jgi:hypothetical protein
MAHPWDIGRRRRRGLWAAAVLTLGGLVFLAAGTLRSDTRALASYLDTTRSIADRESRLASVFQDMVTRLDQLERTALLAGLVDLEETSDQAVADLAATRGPPGAAEAHGLLLVALGSWRDALVAFDEALLLVVDEPDNPQGPLELQAALAELGIGDRAYGRFRTLAGELRQELDVQSAGLPEVSFLPADNPLAYSVDDIIHRARASGLLTLRRDVAVATVKLDPGPVGDQNGIPVVPIADAFSVLAGIINQGNQTESSLVVDLVLERENGTPPYQAQSTIIELAPGASQIVTFGDVPALAGQQSVLSITVQPLEGEADVENNTHPAYAFIRDGG